MDEKTFLESIYQSMQESERQMELLGRPLSQATREQALKQVSMLQAAKKVSRQQKILKLIGKVS